MGSRKLHRISTTSCATRVRPGRRLRVPAEGSTTLQPALGSVVRVFVLGVDPGLSRCGYSVVHSRPGGARAVALGVITTSPADPLPHRLAELQRELRALIHEFDPAVVAVERVLFQVNVRTAMSVGQASGIAMAEGAAAGCEVVQYSPNQVKEAVTGYGAADKLQVQQMVQTLLGLAALPEPPDAADAAALALTHLALSGSATGAMSDRFTGGALAPEAGLAGSPGSARRPPSSPGAGAVPGAGRVKNAVGRSPRPQPPTRVPGASS